MEGGQLKKYFVSMCERKRERESVEMWKNDIKMILFDPLHKFATAILNGPTNKGWNREVLPPYFSPPSAIFLCLQANER